MRRRFADGLEIMFSLFKSKKQRFWEKSVKHSGELITACVYNFWQTKASNLAFKQFTDSRILTELFAGYLVGFSNLLLQDLIETETKKFLNYSRTFFDAVLSSEGGAWAARHLVTLVSDFDAAPLELREGFHAGYGDASESLETNRMIFTRLEQLLLRETKLAA